MSNTSDFLRCMIDSCYLWNKEIVDWETQHYFVALLPKSKTKALFQAVKDYGSDLRSTPMSHAVGYSAKSYCISVTKIGRTLHWKKKIKIKQNCVRRRHGRECAQKYLATLRHATKAVVQLLLWNGWNLVLNRLPSFQVDILILEGSWWNREHNFLLWHTC